MIILDTNVLSELIKPEPESKVLAWLGRQSESSIVTTAVNVQESFFGVELLTDGARKTRLTEALERMYDGLTVLALDEISARYTAVLLAKSQASGHAMHPSDAQIGGISLRYGALLATRNTRDFAHTPVSLVDPWSPNPPAA
jgi:predicted nucleic acid-binding protein